MAVLGLRFCVRAFSSVASGGHSSLRCVGLSLLWPLLLRSTGSRRAGSVIVAHGPSCSAARGIFPGQGSNLCPLHWEADSQPLRHQGSPGLLIFDKGGKTIQWIKDSLFNKWFWKNWTATCKRIKLEHSLTPYSKINSKWIRDLDVRLDTIKLLEENIGKTLCDINHSKILFDPPPREMNIKTEINGT